MNTLYPIFIKTEHVSILIVGAGKVAAEKLTYLLKSSPNAKVSIIAPEFSEEVRQLVGTNENITTKVRSFEVSDIMGHQFVIAATNDRVVNIEVHRAAKASHIPINVADTPELCDFYLGAIVTKGDLKIAISTNGKSPTMAKRIREWLEDILPENIHDLLNNLHDLRKQYKGSFEDKIKYMEEITRQLKP